MQVLLFTSQCRTKLNNKYPFLTSQCEQQLNNHLLGNFNPTQNIASKNIIQIINKKIDEE